MISGEGKYMLIIVVHLSDELNDLLEAYLHDG
jgi:hypothetical protein